MLWLIIWAERVMTLAFPFNEQDHYHDCKIAGIRVADFDTLYSYNPELPLIWSP